MMVKSIKPRNIISGKNKHLLRFEFLEGFIILLLDAKFSPTLYQRVQFLGNFI